MLSPADADLVRRDPNLPGLATLLDAEALVDVLNGDIQDLRVDAAALVYVKYKPGLNCLVGYRLHAGGATVTAYAKAYSPNAPYKVEKGRPSVAGPFGPGRFVLEGRLIEFFVFPNDTKILALGKVVDAAARHRILRKIVPPDLADLREAAIEPLVYKPERRFIARLVAPSGALAVLKVYASAGWPQEPVRRFVSRGPLKVAQVLGRRDRDRIIAFEWLSGRLLLEEVQARDFSLNSMAVVSAALAEVHGQRIDGLQPSTGMDIAHAIRTEAAFIGLLGPRLAGRAATQTERFAARLCDGPSIRASLHGDFHARQVLLGDSTVAILDFDRALAGDPARDLGVFIAHLERQAIRGTLDPNRAESLGQALIEGYQDVTKRVLSDRVRLLAGAELIRLAPRYFRDREPEWPQRIEAVLDRAEEMTRARSVVRGARMPRTSLSADCSSVPVNDPFALATDPKMPFLAGALAPSLVERMLSERLLPLRGASGRLRLRAIRAVRHKPQRRASIEYDLDVERPGVPEASLTLVGKARAKGLDSHTYGLMVQLWGGAGFRSDSTDGVSVPEPVAVLPQFQMWLQRKVRGVPATAMLLEDDGVELAARIGSAIHKVHRAGIVSHRQHTIADELQLLRDRLAIVSAEHPRWKSRVRNLLEGCARLASALPARPLRGIHRDFYADQVIADGTRLYLLDFDLYCQGDPALDLGNFLGHLQEQGLRMLGNPDALADRQAAIEQRLIALAGEAIRQPAGVYTVLTLARHIHMSTQLQGRGHLTEPLLEHCEKALDTALACSPTAQLPSST